MKENFGRCDKDGNPVWVDRGPRVSYKPPKHTRPADWTTFDRIATGNRPQSLRNQGYSPEGVWLERGYPDPEADGFGRPLGIGRSAKDEPYLMAMYDFFQAAIARMPAKVRQDLPAVKRQLFRFMYDRRPLEVQAKELGISKQAVHQAQQRAIAQLVEVFGTKADLAKELRRYLRVCGLDDAWLPRWVW